MLRWINCFALSLMVGYWFILPFTALAQSSRSTPPDKATAVPAKVPSTDSSIEPLQKDVSQRSFEFRYGGAITGLKPAQSARVWLPVATTNHDQSVELIETVLPAEFQITRENKFNNTVLYFQATADQAGEIPFRLTYRVTRHASTLANYESAQDQAGKFLSASRLVPISDELRINLLGKRKPTGTSLEVARQIYDAVNDRMKYDKPLDQPGWGNGDATWACDHRLGNCTDFHSLFIAVARNLKIPAKFEIGFSIPDDTEQGPVAGYHCWAKLLSEDRWVPVDISEANKAPAKKEFYFGNLPPDRVVFSMERDLELAPKSAHSPVNYLVYPYVEVEGQPHQDFRKDFHFQNLPKGTAPE